MKTETLESIAPGNPFLSDLSHMGITMGTNCVVMHPKHSDEVQPYLIIINTETGERLKVDLVEGASTHLADIYNADIYNKAVGGVTARPV